MVTATIPISGGSEAGDLVQGQVASIPQSQDLNSGPCDSTTPSVLTVIMHLTRKAGGPRVLNRLRVPAHNDSDQGSCLRLGAPTSKAKVGGGSTGRAGEGESIPQAWCPDPSPSPPLYATTANQYWLTFYETRS